MRLNRGTIILLVVSLVVIGIVLVINNNQASAPANATTTPSAVTTATTIGPLFPDLDQASIVRFDVFDNNVGSTTTLTKGATDIWSIADATYSADRETDQAAASKAVSDFAGLQANDSFESDKLADFGLDQPDYVVSITGSDGVQQVMYVGNKNPVGNRYYVMIASQEAGFEVTPIVELTDEPTSEATAEVTAEAIVEATAEVTAEVTAEATSEATVEVVADATAESTADSFNGVTPGVTSGTVYLVLVSSVTPLIDLIASPPYVPASTATPSPVATLNPLSEVEQATQTAEFFASVTAIFDQVAATLTAQATVEATAEATAAADAAATPTAEGG